MMQKTWLRRLLKVLLVYFIACTPDMIKLVMMGPSLSVTTVVFVLLSSFVSPWLYLVRMIGGELAYLPAFAPFAILFAIGLAVIWFTERKRIEPKPDH